MICRRLPLASDLVGKPLPDGVYVLVGNEGAATLPFRITREHGGKDFTAFDVQFVVDAETPFPDHATGRLWERDRRLATKEVSRSRHRDEDDPNLPGKRATRLVLTRRVA